MKKLNILSKVSLWVVNIMIFLVIAGGLYSFYSLLTFTGEGERPESTEGMIHWESRHEINIGEYELASVSEYNGEDLGFSDYLELSVPYPALYVNGIDFSESGFKIRPKGEGDYTVSRADDIYLPLAFQFHSESGKSRILWLFAALLTLSLIISLSVLFVFRGFLSSLSKGEFFIQANSRRLIILGAAAFIIPLMAAVGHSISRSFLLDNFQIINGGLDLSRHMNNSPVIFGIVFLLMAGIVHEGSKIKEDSDLTI